MSTTPKLRVLIVDDQPDTAKMLRLLIGGAGHEAQAVGTQAAALEAAAQTPFDVMVCDLRLPDGSGYDLMTKLRARTAIKGIVFTGLSGPEEEARSRSAGFSAFLVKPLDLDKLLDTIINIA